MCPDWGRRRRLSNIHLVDNVLDAFSGDNGGAVRGCLDKGAGLDVRSQRRFAYGAPLAANGAGSVYARRR